jgi:hypothetical protein
MTSTQIVTANEEDEPLVLGLRIVQESAQNFGGLVDSINHDITLLNRAKAQLGSDHVAAINGVIRHYHEATHAVIMAMEEWIIPVNDVIDVFEGNEDFRDVRSALERVITPELSSQINSRAMDTINKIYTAIRALNDLISNVEEISNSIWRIICDKDSRVGTTMAIGGGLSSIAAGLMMFASGFAVPVTAAGALGSCLVGGFTSGVVHSAIVQSKHEEQRENMNEVLRSLNQTVQKVLNIRGEFQCLSDHMNRMSRGIILRLNNQGSQYRIREHAERAKLSIEELRGRLQQNPRSILINHDFPSSGCTIL